MKRVVHYLNQFFGGIGAESQASCPPQAQDGPVGPGLALAQLLGEEFAIVRTVICGDTYFADNTDAALTEILALIREGGADLVVCGPAFNAGRYGLACGRVAAEVQAKLSIPTLTGMYPENPAAELFKDQTFIIPTTDSAKGMRQALPDMARLIAKLADGQALGPAAEEGYLPRGVRKNAFVEENAAERAIGMLLRKLAGEPFQTELKLPKIDVVPPPEPVPDLGTAVICLVTEGGLVPKNNPDGVETGRSTKWFKYPIGTLDDLAGGEYESVHGGYDTVYVNADPDRVVPVDAARAMEKSGAFRELFPYYYVTSGMASAINNCSRMGREIAAELLERRVSAVIGTST